MVVVDAYVIVVVVVIRHRVKRFHAYLTYLGGCVEGIAHGVKWGN